MDDILVETRTLLLHGEITEVNIHFVKAYSVVVHFIIWGEYGYYSGCDVTLLRFANFCTFVDLSSWCWCLIFVVFAIFLFGYRFIAFMNILFNFSPCSSNTRSVERYNISVDVVTISLRMSLRKLFYCFLRVFSLVLESLVRLWARIERMNASFNFSVIS